MWYKAQSKESPKEIDTLSSQKYNYIRRNIKLVDGMYEYEEAKIDKDSWDLYNELQESKAEVEELSTVLDFLLMGDDI